MKLVLVVNAIAILSINAKGQESLNYQIWSGTNLTFPMIHSETSDIDKSISSGKSYLGYSFTISTFKNFGAFSTGLKLQHHYFKFGYNIDRLFFPEDGPAGSTSSLVFEHKEYVIGIGTFLRYSMDEAPFYFQFYLDYNLDLSTKDYQQIFRGYDPSIIDIKTDKDQIFETGPKVGIGFQIGTKPNTSKGFGFIIGPELTFTKMRYYFDALDTRMIRILCGVTYNISN